MITIFFYLTVKPGREEQLRCVGERLIERTRAEDDGCLAYAFSRCADSPRDVVLYEQWRDAAALEGDEQEPFPPTHHRRLPKGVLGMCEATEADRYEPMTRETR